MSGSSDARPRRQRRRTDQRLRAIVSPALIALLRIYAKRRQVYSVLHSNDQPAPGSQTGLPAPSYETQYRRWTVPPAPQQEMQESASRHAREQKTEEEPWVPPPPLRRWSVRSSAPPRAEEQWTPPPLPSVMQNSWKVPSAVQLELAVWRLYRSLQPPAAAWEPPPLPKAGGPLVPEWPDQDAQPFTFVVG